jgi:hypothetical protein
MSGSRPILGRRTARSHRIAGGGAALLIAYLGLAYLLMPWLWERHESAVDWPPEAMLTRTPQGIAGDPINVGIEAKSNELLAAMAAAGWMPADPVTLRSSVEIGISVVLDRPYPNAPVSPLLFEGRRQDLAFELPDGRSADRRHHVRFWQTEDAGSSGRPFWLGSASFDIGVGVSHDTGQITHHIGPDVDAERDLLISGLAGACALSVRSTVPGSGATTDRRNGGGDRYVTDGFVGVGVIEPEFPARRQCAPRDDSALPGPPDDAM